MADGDTVRLQCSCGAWFEARGRFECEDCQRVPPVEASDETKAANYRAANRLNHVGMIYAGGFLEFATGQAVGGIPYSRPGTKPIRDLIQLILLARVELNAILGLLVEKRIVSHEEALQRITSESDWFAGVKAKAYGVDEVTDEGLVYRVNPNPPKGQGIKVN